jgi:L-asparaginase
LAQALTSVAGPGGELQQSAGDRWGHTGEGEGGIIGIEVVDLESGQARGDHKDLLRKKRGKAVFDFNCGGLFRAFYEADDNTGKETPRAMVFREEY